MSQEHGDRANYPGESRLSAGDRAWMWWKAVAALGGEVTVSLLAFFVNRAVKHTDEHLGDRK